MKKYLNFIGSILLGCYVVPMQHFISNYPQFNLKDTFLAMALFLGIFLCIASLFWFYLRNVDKVSFLMYGFAIIFWFIHPIATFLRDNFLFFSKISQSGYQWPLLFVCCFVGILCLFILLKFCPKFIKNVNKILSIFILILSGMLLMCGCQKMFFEIKDGNAVIRNINKEGKIYPNVYHILLDAHPNLEGMKSIGGDLQPFYNKLKSLGFVTFPESRSNYPGTAWTVASMLNMDYLEKDWEIKPRNLLSKIIGNNKVFKYFQTQGFKILFGADDLSIKSLYQAKQFCSADQANLGLCIYHFLLTTPVKHFFEQIFTETFTKSIQNRIKIVFKNLESCKMRYGYAMNVFYTHVLCPHEPIIFAKQACNLCFSGIAMVDNSEYLLDKETHKLYCENIYGIDNLVLESIKKILEQYKTESIKPIIVLHSDHSILKGAKGFKNPCVTIDTVYGNLLALYIPDEWKQEAKDLKFINLYRWIFNHLFSENFEYFKESKQCGWQVQL